MNATRAIAAVAETQTLDPCVVETEPLNELVRDFVRHWLSTRRSQRGRYSSDGLRRSGEVDPIGPYAWLAFDTGLQEEEIRRLRNPVRYPLTELRVADAVVVSIGDPNMFLGEDPLLRILPNPKLPSELTAECCGGST